MTIPQTMNAVILPSPGGLDFANKPVPQPGPEDVLIKVAGCGICGTDMKIRDHGLPGQPPFGSFTPGHEYAGTVVAAGETVDEFAIGDRVVVEAHKGCGRCENCLHGMYTACLNYGKVGKGHRCNGITSDGGMAEYAVNHVTTLYKIPENVSFDEAIMIMTAGSPLYGLERAGGYTVGETVVILGPGPVGLMGVQLCKAMGATEVILTGTREERLKLGKKLGADIVIDVRKENPVAAVLRETGGRGADLVIDCAGGDETLQQCLEMVKRGGRILLVAYYKGPVTADISIAVRNNLNIYTERGEGGRSVGRALALLAKGRIEAKPLITHVFPLAEAQQAYEVLEKRIGDPIKVIIRP